MKVIIKFYILISYLQYSQVMLCFSTDVLDQLAGIGDIIIIISCGGSCQVVVFFCLLVYLKACCLCITSHLSGDML